MRARAIREGSVGLLILIGVGLFGGLVLWLRGLNPGNRSYRATFIFENTLGMQEGTAVRYRGVPIGRVSDIRPNANEVAVIADITQSDLRIPSDSLVEANQSGLIGETTIDITPTRNLNPQELAMSPVGEDCNSDLIICNGDQLPGNVGASYESLIRSAEELANAFADPEIINDLKITLRNASQFTLRATELTDELILLSRQVQGDIDPLLASATRATDNVAAAAAEVEITGREVNTLITSNRASLVDTLTRINRSSIFLEEIMGSVTPAIRDGELLNNLETLTANAAAAAADIEAITSSVNTPENLVMLQQTLESARSVFLSAQKVLADVDELTGDPTLRINIRNLINGLSNLVSLTNQLEQDTRFAQALTTGQGEPIERIRLTQVPASEGMTTDSDIDGSPDGFSFEQPGHGPLLLTQDGRYYRFEAEKALSKE
jgi:phospholipid/cholesterol/gamma-HCH transport system substrate-binding protein